MFGRGIFFRAMLAVLLLVVIVAGGMAAYRMGWGQGYLSGTASASSEAVEPGLLAPGFGAHLYRPYYPGIGFPFFGLCFGIGFIFFVMFLVGGLLKPWGRRRWGYPHHGKWGKGPMPPWAKEWEDFQRYKAEGKDASAESGDEQSESD